HERAGVPVAPVAQYPGGGALVGSFLADQVENALLPVTHGAVAAGAEVAGGASQVLPAFVEQLPTGLPGLPGGSGALGGVLGVLEDQGLQARLDGDRHPARLLRLAPHRRAAPVAPPPPLG